MFKETSNRRILGMNRRKMSEVHEIENDVEKVSYKWGAKTKSNIIIRYVKTHMGEIPENEIEETYDYIHSKMQNDGYSEKEIIRFIEHNKELLDVNKERLSSMLGMFSSKEQADKVFYEYPKILERKVPLGEFYLMIQGLDEEFGYSEINKAIRIDYDSEIDLNTGVTKKQMEKTYNFIIQKFLNDGFSEAQAREFVLANPKLLEVPKHKLISELAILKIASLDDKVFYENPDLISSMPSLSRIYGAIKYEESRTSTRDVNDIRIYLSMSSKKQKMYDNMLTKNKLNIYYTNYKTEFDKKTKEREQSQTLLK